MVFEKDRKRKTDNDVGDEHTREKKSKNSSSQVKSPDHRREKEPRRRRKRSRSNSPIVKQEKQSNDATKDAFKNKLPERKTKETDMLNTRTGGAYIPPARLRMMQAQISDKSSAAYQRLAWEALKKSIHGHINKINVGNIGIIIKQLLRENIVRGRGLLCRSVIQAQAASPTFTNVYAALVAAVNSRFPNIGELLLKRLVIQFKRGFKRNDKPICISSASFIAHLVNQRIAHEILALELLTLLVETPTDDSVEVAIAFLKECGQKLTEVSSKGVNAIFEMLRNILHEGHLDKRVQYMIEVMFQIWKDGFKDHPAVIEELELVPEEEQFTHLLMLDDATDAQDILNVFKFDEKFEENEQKYKNLSKEILGSDAESGDEEGSGSESGSEESDDEDESKEKQNNMTIIDNTETNLIALRRTIYLTINSSLDFEECAHKLMKMQLKPGQEVELCHMFLDCCAEQRTYEKFYGLLAQRFCNINRIYIGPFEEIFKDSYATAHRLDTNRLRNVSKFFAHLLFTDSISWEVLECVKLNEEDTTSSSRIYIKILFQELAEYMGLKKLNDRLKDQTLQGAFSGVFPRDNPKNTRFSINFFTSIGLGGLTDELREHLKQMPKNVPPAVTEIKVASESSSSSDSSSSSSDSEDESSKKKEKKSKGPKTPEPEPEKEKQERWGHDGFYDTYGKDARRTESRPPRIERDKDNFVIPRNPRDRSERNPTKDREDRRARDDERDSERKRDRDESSRSHRREPYREERESDMRKEKRNDDHYDDSRSKRRESENNNETERSNRKSSDDYASYKEGRESDMRKERRNDDFYDDSRSKRRESENNNDTERRNRRSSDDYASYKEGRESDMRKERRNDDHYDDARSKRRDSEITSETERNNKRNSDDYASRSRTERREDDSRSDKKEKEASRNNDKEVISDKYNASTSKSGRSIDDNELKSRKEKREDYYKADKEKKSRKQREESCDSDNATTSKKPTKDSGFESDDKRKSKKKNKKKNHKEDSDSGDKSSKKSKKSKKEKENDWDIKSKRDLDRDARKSKTNSNNPRYGNDREHMDEWDIRRPESVTREVTRYWDKQSESQHESRDDRS